MFIPMSGLSNMCVYEATQSFPSIAHCPCDWAANTGVKHPRLFVNNIDRSKKLVRNEAKLNFDKAFTDFVLFFVKPNDAFHEEISSKTVWKIETLFIFEYISIMYIQNIENPPFRRDMDGLGSPDSMMDHSMLDLKGSSPYACYSSPKLSYDVFPTQRGRFYYRNCIRFR